MLAFFIKPEHKPMLVYSQKIISFISEIKHTIKNVLSKEMGFKVFGDRFYDKQQRYSYPIKVVIFNNQKMLGYFESCFFEIGINEILMHSSKKQLHDIIRHELAHYIAFIIHGNTITPHGLEFKALCRSFGFDEAVYSATTCLDDQAEETKEEESAILRKIQKLIALSSSSNENESEQAMLKSQSLLLKHNLEASSLQNEPQDRKIYLKRVLMQKKKDAKMRSIALILETFFVNIVYSGIKGATCLEITGEKTNVEIADYVTGFLSIELDKLWKDAKKKHAELRGSVSKRNSYLLGIATGYCNKLKFLKQEYQASEKNSLMIIEKKLIEMKDIVYPRLSKTTSSASHCANAAFLGNLAGKNLQIKPGIARSPSTHSTALLE